MANRRHAMHHLRKSMRKYRDPAVAVAAGWVATDECVELPDGSGGMGFHYFNPQLASAKPRLRHPAVLVYVPTRRRVAAGWARSSGSHLMPTRTSPPTPTGRTSGRSHSTEPIGGPPAQDSARQMFIPTCTRWLFRHNPNGRFASFNPRVHC